MIVCSCNVLTKTRVIAAAEALSRKDPLRPITPGRLFRSLDARPQCGTCFAHIRRIVAREGMVFTCPEPLATVAGADSRLAALAMEGVFDPSDAMD
jgi:bacterioferritin-associated ferredoxin